MKRCMFMLRAAALSLLVSVLIAGVLPTINSSAHHTGKTSVSRRHRVRRHSRAWWRRYRARLRRKRAALARKRALAALRHRNPSLPKGTDNRALRIADHREAPLNRFTATGGVYNDTRGFSLTMPKGWVSSAASPNGERKFYAYAPDGRVAGQAALSVIPAHSRANNVMTIREQRRTLNGVPLAELRRVVIDKMVASNGWVINDLQREIGGRRVFVVVAQSAASADGRTPQQSWIVYFTEIDGRIYSLTVSAPVEFSDRMSFESEQLVASFRTGNGPAVARTSAR